MKAGGGIEFAGVKSATAIEAGDRAFDAADSRKFLAATGTAIEVTPRSLLHGKRKRMATRFVRDAEIVAGAAPFRAMRRNAAASGAKLCEQMRQLVAQRAIDLSGIVLAQARVQRDQVAA